jgi:hypothetical protein
MNRDNFNDEDLYRFILLEIGTVPHLEALLLLWRNCPRSYSEAELATLLFVNAATARTIAHDLGDSGLIANEEGRYRYDSNQTRKNALLEALADLYRRELINITKLIHSKKSSAPGKFARAFTSPGTETDEMDRDQADS